MSNMAKKSKKLQVKKAAKADGEKQLDDKCDYKTGACKGMRDLSSYDNGGRGKGIIAASNIVNVRVMGKMFHKGFFLRSEGTKDAGHKNGVMLNFCPWCGADLQEWHRQFREEFEAEAKKFDEKNPDYEERKAKAKAEFEKERQEFLDQLDPEVRKALTKLTYKQQEALQEAWVEDGRFLNGTDVRHNTIESIKNPDRKLVSKGRLTTFGKKVREAAQEIPSGYMLP